MRFEEFAGTRLPSLLRYATVLTADPVQAQDIVQDVLVKACTRWRRIEATDRPDDYVRKMVLNEFLSWRRRWQVRSIRPAPDDVLDAGQPPGPDHAAEIAERDDVWRRLAELPPRRRAVVVLRFYGDLDDDQIAEQLGIRPASRSRPCRSASPTCPPSWPRSPRPGWAVPPTSQ